MQNNYKKSCQKRTQYKGRKWKKCVCHLCDKLHHVKDVKVRNHCQITGKYRISARQKCNVNSRLNEKIPVIFHDFKDIMVII